MAVTYANQVENHRGIYFEATGDGATTALVVSHNKAVPTNATATASVTTGPTSFHNGKSGSGGFVYPFGTAVTVSSVTVTKTQVTVNTSVAVGNGTKAYVAVVFDQESASN